MKKTLIKAISSVLFLAMLLGSMPTLAMAVSKKQLYGTGLIFDSIETVEAHLYREDLPTPRAASVDLTSKFPTPGYQGSQESCVAWAVGYALKSYQEKVRYDWNINSSSHHFSPAYIYNQINGGSDNGAKISDAMKLIINQGACSLTYFPYNELNYTQQPTGIQNAAAALYKARSWHTVFGTNNIKNCLADGRGVVVGIKIYSDFYNLGTHNQVYDDSSGSNPEDHAICLIGYDDNKGASGAFKFINSWGTGYGLGGYGWISYDLINSLRVNPLGVGYVLNNRTADDYLMGDVNGDGKVTAVDARKILNFSASTETPTNAQFALSDVNGDAKVTAVDARAVLQYSAELIDKLPLYN